MSTPCDAHRATCYHRDRRVTVADEIEGVRTAKRRFVSMVETP